MLRLREAIEASWKPDTAYHHAEEVDNPALGQCYVTSRVIQYYFPEAEIVEGECKPKMDLKSIFGMFFIITAWSYMWI